MVEVTSLNIGTTGCVSKNAQSSIVVSEDTGNNPITTNKRVAR